MIDDGTIANRRGSLNVDDEGNPTQQNVLIENGVLRGYLQDKLSSRMLQVRIHRQRPPRKLSAHPHAAHDEHFHAGRAKAIRKRSSAPSQRACTARTSAAARWTSPAATSSSRRPRAT